MIIIMFWSQNNYWINRLYNKIPLINHFTVNMYVTIKFINQYEMSITFSRNCEIKINICVVKLNYINYNSLVTEYTKQFFCILHNISTIYIYLLKHIFLSNQTTTHINVVIFKYNQNLSRVSTYLKKSRN